jgi:hypothetical protein
LCRMNVLAVKRQRALKKRSCRKCESTAQRTESQLTVVPLHVDQATLLQPRKKRSRLWIFPVFLVVKLLYWHRPVTFRWRFMVTYFACEKCRFSQQSAQPLCYSTWFPLTSSHCATGRRLQKVQCLCRGGCSIYNDTVCVWPCHSSGALSLASHRGSPGFNQLRSFGICDGETGTWPGFLESLYFPCTHSAYSSPLTIIPYQPLVQHAEKWTHFSPSVEQVKYWQFYPCNRSWMPSRMEDVKDPTLSTHSAHRWRSGCQPYASAAL